jgi:hypothetical protein
VTTTLEAELPSYSDEHLARVDPDALIDLLVVDEDRVPRNVIDAAARLGDAMVLVLQDRLSGPWDDSVSVEEWWVRLHGIEG